MTTTTVDSARQDARILGLVSTGHFCSHFYLMCLPPLFPLMNQDLGISFTALGLMLSLRSVATSVAQVPAGFLVDRYGAKLVLLAGLLVMVAGLALFATVSSYWLLVFFVVLGGIGDSVFHPADYAILNASVAQERMGRAFSVHTFSGHLGFAVAPSVVAFLAALWDWRIALLLVSLFGFIIAMILVAQWQSLKDDRVPGKKKKGAEDAAAIDPNASWLQRKFGMLLNAPVLSLFGFFVISTLASSGISSFSISALSVMHDIEPAALGLPITGFMLASAFAVLAGGVLADKLPMSASVFAGLGFIGAAVVVLLIGLLPLPYFLLLTLFPIAGFFLGVIRPARDLMVRDAAPKGQAGKVFGFVFSGQSVGSSIAPLLYGLILDNFPPSWVFYASTIFLVVGVVTVISTAGVRHGKEVHS